MTLCLPEPPTSQHGGRVCYLNLVVPETFRAAVERHHIHLLELATSLEAAHLPRAEIEGHVTRLIESYRAQLLTASDQYDGDQHA